MTRSAGGLSPDVVRLATLFAVSGTLHFVRPRPYERIVPHALTRKRDLVYITGAAELACAAGLFAPRTRRLAGLASAALLVAIFPANVQMAVDSLKSRRPFAMKVGTVVRLPMQWPMIRTGWRTFTAR